METLENVLEAALGRLGPAAKEVNSTAWGPAGGGTRGVRKRMAMVRRVAGNMLIELKWSRGDESGLMCVVFGCDRGGRWSRHLDFKTIFLD